MSITMEELKDIHPDLLYMEEFEEALMGIVERVGVAAVCYNTGKIIEILMRDMPYHEAVEHFEYNIAGAYVGEHTPFYFSKIRLEPKGESK